MERLSLKSVSRLAQRVQREATGYYCGYTFKGQTIGRRLVLLASKSLNFVEPDLAEKTQTQQWRRVVNRVFTDVFHRCTSRPAAEEYNLVAFASEQDVTNAEFIRTFSNRDFYGGALLRRLQLEIQRQHAFSEERGRDNSRCLRIKISPRICPRMLIKHASLALGHKQYFQGIFQGCSFPSGSLLSFRMLLL